MSNWATRVDSALFWAGVPLVVIAVVMAFRIVDLRDQIKVLEAERAFRNIEAETGRSCVPLLGECVEVLRGEVARRER